MTEPWQLPETYEPLAVRPPQSWLLREGWKILAVGSIGGLILVGVPLWRVLRRRKRSRTS